MYTFINDKGQEYVAYGHLNHPVFLLPFRKRYKNQVIITNTTAVIFALIANSSCASHQITGICIALAGLVQVINFSYVISNGARTPTLKSTELQPAIWQAHAHTMLTIVYVFLMSNTLVNLFLSL